MNLNLPRPVHGSNLFPEKITFRENYFQRKLFSEKIFGVGENCCLSGLMLI